MNRRGIALIMSYLVIVVLMILSSAFVVKSISESNIAKKYADSTRAFWIAEAGLSQAYHNWVNEITQPTGAVDFAGGTYTINTAHLPQVTLTGVFAGSTRIIQAYFVSPVFVFDNTLSVGGNLSLVREGFSLATINVNDKTRISGTY